MSNLLVKRPYRGMPVGSPCNPVVVCCIRTTLHPQPGQPGYSPVLLRGPSCKVPRVSLSLPAWDGSYSSPLLRVERCGGLICEYKKSPPCRQVLRIESRDSGSGRSCDQKACRFLQATYRVVVIQTAARELFSMLSTQPSSLKVVNFN